MDTPGRTDGAKRRPPGITYPAAGLASLGPPYMVSGMTIPMVGTERNDGALRGYYPAGIIARETCELLR